MGNGPQKVSPKLLLFNLHGRLADSLAYSFIREAREPVIRATRNMMPKVTG